MAFLTKLACLLLILFACSSLATSAYAQTRVIELEIHSSARAIVGSQQRWMEALHDVGADKVVVKTSGLSRPDVEETKLASTTLITITGILKNNQLKLPGGKFSINNKAGIRNLIQRLRDDGADVALAEKKAFGFTTSQLTDLHKTLRQPLNFKTQGQSVSKTVNRISQLVGIDFSLDVAARQALTRSATLSEELEGMSAGTALAIAVRPLGLSVLPERQQGQSMKIRLIRSRDGVEVWPVGWPLAKSPLQTEPKLFETFAIEVRGFPLIDVLNAIESRCDVPLIFDHQSLTRRAVDLQKTKVDLVQDKSSYMVAIGKLLRQSKPKLIDELRIDENGKPFLWITTQY